MKNTYDTIIAAEFLQSSYWTDENGNATTEHTGTPGGIVYAWEVVTDNGTYNGRSISEFADFVNGIEAGVIWFRDLSDSFPYLCNVFGECIETFARAEHKPLYAIFEKRPGIKFRDASAVSSVLNVNIHYDTTIKTPLSDISNDELLRLHDSVAEVYDTVKNDSEVYNGVKNIPLTQTGKIRRQVRKAVMNNKANKALLNRLVPANVSMYSCMKAAFIGGYVHANESYLDTVVYGGSHNDFASSYPAVMFMERYPMTRFQEDEYEADEDKAYLMKVHFDKVECLTDMPFIPVEKIIDANVSNYAIDNGKVVFGCDFDMWLTNVDFETICNTYEVECNITECYSSELGYLPTELLNELAKAYEKKTTLKGVKGSELEYKQNKEFINSFFGMCVTDIILDQVLYSPGEWYTNKVTIDDIADKISTLRNSSSSSYFVAYQWGLWITAYARKNLFECIDKAGSRCIYCDTDSMFVDGMEIDFTDYNEKVIRKLHAMCDATGINYDMICAKDIYGNVHIPGTFEREADFVEFKTLGAKRYVVRENGSNELVMAVSGVNKSASAVLNNNIDNFNDGLIFDGIDSDVNLVITNYTTDQVVTRFEDGYVNGYKYGVNKYPTTHALNSVQDVISALDLALFGNNCASVLDLTI